MRALAVAFSRPLALALSILLVPAFACAQQGAPDGQLPGVKIYAPPAEPEAKPEAAKQPAKKPAAKSKGDDSKDSAAGSGQAIAVLVNDEPITAYEIEQRMKLASLGSSEMSERMKARLSSPKVNDQFRAFAIERLKANPPKTKEENAARVKALQVEFVEGIRRSVLAELRPHSREKAIDELVDEHLKLQEAKRLNVVASDEDVDRAMRGLAERNKMTDQQFAALLKSQGTDAAVMRNRYRAALSWTNVIRRKFGGQVFVAERDVDRLVAKAPNNAEDEIELELQRVTLPIAKKPDQRAIAARFQEADALRSKIGDCKSSASAAAGVNGAKFENLGVRKAGSIAEPTRSLLLSAKEGESIPPAIGIGGIEVWVVCGRKTIAATEKVREAAESELQQKEFELLAQRHLRDLRQDALIEKR